MTEEGKSMKRKNVFHLKKAAISAVLAISMMFATISTITVRAESAEEDPYDVESTDWMSMVPGDTALSSISIPGTHDSAAQYVFPGYFMKCQDTSIEEQLENGYRYFDMRLVLGQDGEDKPYLKLKHNFANCRTGKSLFSDAMKVDDVIDTMYDFLMEHPTETIIFTCKAEDSDDDIASIQNLLYEKIDGNPTMWYTVNEIPTLDDVRGKIVLATRFEDVNAVGETRRGLNFQWTEQNSKEIVDIPYVNSMMNDTQQLWVQDRFKYNTESKWEAVVDDMENCQADDDTFSLNFTSTAGSGWLSHQEGYAKYINQQLLDYDMQTGVCYGVVIVDFGTEEIAKHIYETNFY
jgi:1-phosphatidylinositol phosphodiesterase